MFGSEYKSQQIPCFHPIFGKARLTYLWQPPVDINSNWRIVILWYSRERRHVTSMWKIYRILRMCKAAFLDSPQHYAHDPSAVNCAQSPHFNIHSCCRYFISLRDGWTFVVVPFSGTRHHWSAYTALDSVQLRPWAFGCPRRFASDLSTGGNSCTESLLSVDSTGTASSKAPAKAQKPKLCVAWPHIPTSPPPPLHHLGWLPHYTAQKTRLGTSMSSTAIRFYLATSKFVLGSTMDEVLAYPRSQSLDNEGPSRLHPNERWLREPLFPRLNMRSNQHAALWSSCVMFKIAVRLQ